MSIFYSFHYGLDYWRVQQIRNIGHLGETRPVAAQKWESVRFESDVRIINWIEQQMKYKRAVVVLIGSETSSRRWVQYEIEQAWAKRKPLLGIRIDGLQDQYGRVTRRGEDPFLNLGYSGIPVFDPKGAHSSDKYVDIGRNLRSWIGQGRTRL